jgi:hypothetical protein
MTFAIRGIDSSFVELIRNGREDANGQRAVHRKAIGMTNPCRHSLQ